MKRWIAWPTKCADDVMVLVEAKTRTEAIAAARVKLDEDDETDITIEQTGPVIPWPVEIPRPYGTNSVLCDALFGPCACGDWHEPGDIPRRVRLGRLQQRK